MQKCVCVCVCVWGGGGGGGGLGSWQLPEHEHSIVSAEFKEGVIMLCTKLI